MPRPPKQHPCNTPGCPTLTTHTHCQTHSTPAWANTTTTPRSRGANTTTRQRILDRDRHTCYICGQAGANQVDHITPVFEGGAETDDNLAAIHATPCHQTKTRTERVRARWPTT